MLSATYYTPYKEMQEYIQALKEKWSFSAMKTSRLNLVVGITYLAMKHHSLSIQKLKKIVIIGLPFPP